MRPQLREAVDVVRPECGERGSGHTVGNRSKSAPFNIKRASEARRRRQVLSLCSEKVPMDIGFHRLNPIFRTPEYHANKDSEQVPAYVFDEVYPYHEQLVRNVPCNGHDRD